MYTNKQADSMDKSLQSKVLFNGYMLRCDICNVRICGSTGISLATNARIIGWVVKNNSVRCVQCAHKR